MKILHIITDTNIGGAGKLLVAVLNNIDRETFDVCVALPRGSALLPLIEKTGTRVVLTEHGADKSFESAAVRELCRIIKAEKPDAVHTHASMSGRIAAKIAGVPIRTMTRHCAFPVKERNKRFPIKQIVGGISDMLTTRYIATALVARDELIEMGCDEKKITVIKNGSERVIRADKSKSDALRATLGIPDGAFVAGISARLEEYKGHRYLIDAAALTCDENVYYLIVGDGSEWENLRAYAKERGVSDKVIFAGFASDVAPYYSIFDVALNCSTGTETTPLGVTEPMSIGVPAIVSDYGGNTGIVESGRNGIVVPQRDADALAGAILSLYGDRELLRKLGEGAKRSYDEEFSAGAMTKKLEKVYLSLEAEYEAENKKAR
ncbi:MAG: glycosyltransferase [Clostridiales bacterium]|nr:glycosyltransferase [Clostridiales bacterium]